MAYTRSSSALLAFCVAVLFVGGASAIQCYSCFSAENPDCLNEPVPDKYLVNCSNPALAGVGAGRNASCQKILQKLDGDNGYRVTRQCSGVTRLDCIERVGTRGVRAWYCHCANKDKCNGAGQLSVASSSMLLVFVAIMLAKFDR